jgi:hypothetical protein
MRVESATTSSVRSGEAPVKGYQDPRIATQRLTKDIKLAFSSIYADFAILSKARLSTGYPHDLSFDHFSV